LLKRQFSSKPKPPPSEFYNHDEELEKEFHDLTWSITKGGLENMTSLKEKISLDAASASSLSGDEAARKISIKEAKSLASFIRPADLDEQVSGLYSDDDEISSDGGGPLPVNYLNYNVNWTRDAEHRDTPLDEFIPDTSPYKYADDEQGDRHCPGKRQRYGMKPQFGCHLIDLDELNHLDVITLSRFVTEDSEILGRKETGLCAKCQRKVAKTIKRARNLGLVPHLGEYVVQDSRAVAAGKAFHDCSVKEKPLAKSKTIL
jgi:small subunit ribosomal protein S18